MPCYSIALKSFATAKIFSDTPSAILTFCISKHREWVYAYCYACELLEQKYFYGLIRRAFDFFLIFSGAGGVPVLPCHPSLPGYCGRLFYASYSLAIPALY
jgi:hypothetical protein